MFLFSFDLLGGIDTQGASLPTWAIVLLAVSFSLLLILIIVLIIIFCCCCVSRKEKKGNLFVRMGLCTFLNVSSKPLKFVSSSALSKDVLGLRVADSQRGRDFLKEGRHSWGA